MAAPEDFDIFVHILLTDPDPRYRILAVDRLIESGDDRMFDSFIQAVKINDKKIAWWILRSLARLGTTHAYDTLYHILENSDFTLTSSIVAAGFLAHAKDARITVPLITLYRDPHCEKNKDRIIQILSTNASPQALAVFEDAARSENEQMRLYAAAGLGKLHDNRASPLLATLLQSDDIEIYGQAIGALSEYGREDAIPALQHMQKTGDETYPLYADKPKTIAVLAAQAITRIMQRQRDKAPGSVEINIEDS